MYNLCEMCLKYNSMFLFEKQGLMLLLQVIVFKNKYMCNQERKKLIKKYLHALFSFLTFFQQCFTQEGKFLFCK